MAFLAAVQEEGLRPAREIETRDVIHLTKLPTAKFRQLIVSPLPGTARLGPRGMQVSWQDMLSPSTNAVTQLVTMQNCTGRAQPWTQDHEMLLRRKKPKLIHNTLSQKKTALREGTMVAIT